MTLKELQEELLRIRETTGSVCFEMYTPDDEGDWEVARYGKHGREAFYGESLEEALNRLKQG